MSTEFVNAISSLPILAGRSICDQSGYAIDSAYQKVSAMSSYALSANVSGVIDTVSSNSASWGNGGVVSSISTGTYGGITCVDNINNFKLFAMYADSATTAGYAVNDDAGNLIRTAYAKASSLEDKADSSALSSYALSANVSGCIDTVSSNSASWGAGASLPITGSAGTDSATYGPTSVEYTRYDTAGEPDIRTATLSPDALNIMSTVDGNDYYSVNISENGIEFGDPDGYYSVNPSDISTWNSAVETVANNSATWGGGVQVVTATGSASATSFTGGYPPIATSYMVSSINGSAILPYGYSTLSGNSAKWTSTNSAVSANSAGWTSTNSAVSANSAKWASTNTTVRTNSANWNSVYNTVSSNSASWSESTGGSVTSPSGTIMVMNGNEIEATNSAVLTASSESGFTTSFDAGDQIPAWTVQELYAGTLPGSGATLYIPTQNISPDNTAIISGKDSNMAIVTASGLASGTPFAIYLGPIVNAISASAYSYIHIDGDVTADKEGGITVTGIGELAWASSVSGVVNTVSSNSATWGQGGVDSATVSSIASSYAESAVSGKLDTTAQVVSATAGDGVYITSINGSALSGAGGGGGVVTATGSAWDGVVIRVSSVNGSSLWAVRADTATYDSDGHSITGTYVPKSQYSSVSNCVVTNSGAWGANSSLSSPSGTIVVNGDQLEGTNSAVLTESASGFSSVVALNRTTIAYSLNRLYDGTLPGTGALVTLSSTGGAMGYNSTFTFSGATEDGTLDSASAEAAFDATTITVQLGNIVSAISASGTNYVYLAPNMTAEKASGLSVTGIGELAWKSAVDDVTNTVSANSASWGQGGVDSATVSSIASAYAESAVSSKADSSALSIKLDTSAIQAVANSSQATANGVLYILTGNA